MSFLKQPLALCAGLFFVTTTACAQGNGSEVLSYENGYVNFNLAPEPILNAGRQELSLYGCNTQISTRDIEFNGATNLEWGKDNQIYPNVPYGWREDQRKRYFISKYYMASPPVQHLLDQGAQSDDQLVDIGLVIPDRFTFFGEKPVQIVHLNYSILQHVYLNFVDVDFDYKYGVNPSLNELGVDFVPINIQCPDFAWSDPKTGSKLEGAKGASGIGRLRSEDGTSKVFLPSYKPDSEFLDCQITILDDILLHFEVFFVTEHGLKKTMNLTEFHTRFPEGKIKLFARQRVDLPAGCRGPEE